MSVKRHIAAVHDKAAQLQHWPRTRPKWQDFAQQVSNPLRLLLSRRPDSAAPRQLSNELLDMDGRRFRLILSGRDTTYCEEFCAQGLLSRRTPG